ncbi:OmpA family protein [Cruoricaptor ignavus]|uniref:OmpA family protein n=1 Tax=Cruoricaptor ignavus TaxID=1118202 RepID=UPI00370D509F
MRITFLLLTLPVAAAYAQSATETNDRRIYDGYPNTFSSEVPYVEKFRRDSKLFRDWTVTIGGGGAFMHSADLHSFYDDKIEWGYSAFVNLEKHLSHTFGLALQYQHGETNQKGQADWNSWATAVQKHNGRTPKYEDWGVGTASTKFDQVSLLGDINFSSLMRRVDSRNNYRWALHGYAGIGIQHYETLLTDNSTRWNNPLEIDQKMDQASFISQFGLGLNYNVNKLIDLELRGMYYITGDDEFDGGGWESSSAPKDNRYSAPREVNYPYNFIKKNNSDNFFTVSLGLSFKLGKHDQHLKWAAPLKEIDQRLALIAVEQQPLEVCKKGDGDNDGVCDDWDRQLDTPAGARVDGAGVALDMDLDGVIDLYDKCPTVPGPLENNGCPTTSADIMHEINRSLDGIEFELNSDKIRPSSYAKLDQAASFLLSGGEVSSYKVIGATDSRGKAAYNLNLSQRRANAVVQYLVQKGVSRDILQAEGRGMSDLKYPECVPATKCPEWKNEANRRVFFERK